MSQRIKVNETLKKLDSIEFHDIPVENIQLFSDPDIELIVTFFKYNEPAKEYDKLEIRFKEITEMELGTLLLKSDSEIEIYRSDYSYMEEFSGNILFLLGQSSAELKITCKEIGLKTI